MKGCRRVGQSTKKGCWPDNSSVLDVNEKLAGKTMRLMIESHDTDGKKNVHRFFEISVLLKTTMVLLQSTSRIDEMRKRIAARDLVRMTRTS